MEAVKKGSDFYIPTYVINMKERLDRKKHIIGEFKGRDEFDVTYMDACTHTIGAVGLWNSIVRIIRLALENEDDVIVVTVISSTSAIVRPLYLISNASRLYRLP